MSDTLESELESEFGMFGIDISGNIAVLEKLKSICSNHGLTCDSIIAKWFTYNNKSGQVITPDILDDFEKKLAVSEKTAKKVVAKNTYNSSTINQIISEVSVNFEDTGPEDYSNDIGYGHDSSNIGGEENVIGSYATTPKSHETNKRLHTTPDEPVFNKRGPEFAPHFNKFSPVSMSPAITTPSLKYESRTGKGDVICCFGIHEKVPHNWKGCAEDIVITPFSDCNVPSQYKYMFQKLQDKANVLNEMITALSVQMKENLLLDEYENVLTQTQEDITISGRICCDSVGRLNSKSILLEGSIETSGGQQIPLELGDVSNYSLFPGQIVAIRGRNGTGAKVHPSSIYCGSRLPFYSATKKDMKINEGNFSLYAACGPYATNDTETLSYTPLENLMEVIQKEKPDVLIMLGPFVDIKHPLIQTGKIDFTYDELFLFVCNMVTSTIKSLGTEVIFIPSQRDICHHCVYPQPPFKEEPTRRIRMMPDPCTIMINDVSIGITSTDILFHLGAEEVSSFTVRTDRLGRLADHLLKQQCYYPLYPTSEEVNLEYEQFGNYCFMPFTPDILLVPSDLRYFAKNVDGCLCVNPGRLVKGQTGGSFLKLLVKPQKCENTNWSSVVDNSIAQIVRI